MKKRIGLVLLSVLLLLVTGCHSTYGYLQYRLEGGKAVITGYDADMQKNVSIPDTIEGCSVTTIREGAFMDCSLLVAIDIPDTVKVIEDDAFRKCRSLTEVEMGNAVTEIGNSAFAHCKKLTAITIPDSVTYLGDRVFYQCGALTTVTVGNKVKEIRKDTFNGCKNLLSAALGAEVTTIGEHAFGGCARLTTITIPADITAIDARAFQDCKRLRDVYFAGTEADREKIKIGGDNDPLFEATWHYGVTQAPVEEETP